MMKRFLILGAFMVVYLVLTAFAQNTGGQPADRGSPTSNRAPDHSTSLAPLRGDELGPPIISVTPGSIAEALLTGGTSDQTLRIANSGESDLIWQGDAITAVGLGLETYTLTAPRAGAIDPETGKTYPGDGFRTTPISASLRHLTNVHILWDRKHGGSPSSGWSVIVSDLTARGATISENTQTLTSEILENFDALWLTDLLGPFSSSEITAVQAWIRGGGSLILECDQSSSRIASLLSGLGSGITFFETPAQAGNTTQILPHRMTEGVGAVYFPGPQDRLEVAAPARALVADATGVPVCAYSEVDEGNIFAVADETFADGPVGSADNQLFGNQVIDWLTRRVDWLSVAPAQGTVPPGSFEDVTVTFDAAGLFGGDYDAGILITNNDPLSPEVTVPAHLHVTGAPDIAVSESLLDYGEVFIGAAIPRAITISNVGTSQLVVSDISSSHPDYTVDVTSFSLAPAEGREVIVTFAPTSVGPIPGALTITSNDPDEGTVGVELQGGGLEPPVISVAPGSIAGDLFTGGTSEQMLRITNSGQNDLIWQGDALEVEVGGTQLYRLTAPRSGAIDPETGEVFPEEGSRTTAISAALRHLTDVRILWDRAHGGSPLSGWSVIMSDLTGRGATVVENHQTFSPVLLEGYDVVWLTDPLSPFSSSEIAAVQAWVRAGGSLLIECDDCSYQIGSLLTELGSGIGYDPVAAHAGSTTRIHPHEMTEGVASVYLPGPQDHLVVSSPAQKLVDDSSNVPVCAFSVVDEGNIFAVADETFADGPVGSADNQLFGNKVMDWLTRRVDWLSVAPAQGTVPPGSFEDVTATFDAAGLFGGDYDAGILITNNDPLSPEVTVHAHLHVTGAPDVTVSETLVDFGEVFTGSIVTHTITVFNKGADQLVVSDISSSHPDYTVDVASFSLAPAESRDVIVTFAPTSIGPIPGMLTITSNDPDEGMVGVELRGDCVEPPIISVTPDSLADDLFTGETSAHTLTITNSGGSDLTWNASTAFPEVFGAPIVNEYTLTAPRASVVNPETGKTSPAGDFRTTAVSASLDDLTGVRILWDESHGEFPPEYWSVILADVTARGATVTVNFSPVTPALLEDYDIMWMTDFDTWWDPAEIQAVHAWVRSGGALLLESDESQDKMNAFLSGLGSGITYLYTAAAIGTTTLIYPHPTTENVGGVYLDYPRASLDVVTPGGILVDDVLLNHAAVYSEISAGRIIAVSEEIFGDYTIGFADNQLFGNQVIDWLARRIEWLNIAPSDGTVPPGNSEDVTVTFDAARLFGGDYDTDILFHSSDPADPEVAIPAHLHVTGAPEIVVSEDVVDYGPVAVGHSLPRTITISNKGTDDLVVSDISSSHPDYTADVTSFTLAPAENRVVIVTFAPASVGPILGALTITSNDPDEGTVGVELRGQGVEPPIISVTPGSIDDDLFTGETSVHTLTITNSGGSNLTWNASKTSPQGLGAPVINEYTLTVPDARATYPESVTNQKVVARTSPISAALRDLTGVRILWDRKHGGSPSSGWSVMVSDITGRGATVTENTAIVTPSLLEGYDVLWLTDFSSSFSGSEITAVQEWIRAGGSLLLECDESSSRIVALLSGLGSGITYESVSALSGYTTLIHPHEMTRGIGTVYLPGPQSYLEISSPAQWLVNDKVDVPVCAFSEVDDGKIFAVADETFADGPVASADNQLFGNQVIDWLSWTLAWLSVAPAQGTVPPGNFEDVTVTFDAAGLFGGDYDAGILIMNDDPLNAEVTVATHLHVTGAPDITVSETLVDYGSVFMGAEIPHTITVSNEGADQLVVSDISSSHPDYTVDVTSFSLAPAESRGVIVTFAPTSVGPIPGALTITSNDPDEGTVGVELQGHGLEPPIISVNPDSLAVALMTGESSTRTLTITNSGGNNLTWAASANYIRGLGATAMDEYTLTAPIAAATYPESEANQTAVARTTPISATLRDLTGVRILWNRRHGGSPKSGWSVMESDITGRGATVTESSDVFTPSMLEGYDVLWLTDPLLGAFTGSEITAVQAWLRAGGSILIECDEASSRIASLLSGLGCGIAYNDTPGQAGTTTRIHPHELMVGVTSVFLPGPQDHLVISAPAVALVDDLVNVPVCAISEVELGRIFAVADETFADGPVSSADNQLFGNRVVDWLSARTVWLGIDPSEGTIPPETSQDLTVTFDAVQLYAGTYDASIEIQNNDPVNPDVAVPTRLRVSGIPDIEVSPASIDFGKAYVGIPVVRVIEVANRGTDSLTVSHVNSTNPDISCDPPSFTVPVFGTGELTITLLATAPRIITDTITISSNDPDEGELVINAVGEARFPPEIAISPSSFNAALLSGEKSVQILSISNPGGSQLQFRITVVPAAAGESPGAAGGSPGPSKKAETPTGAADWTLREGALAAEWLTVAPTAGLVDPADTAHVTVTLNAAGLAGGTYQANLSIATNIPATLPVVVPAEMVVTSGPAIAVSDTILAFGEVYVGYEKTMDLRVSNIGFEMLVVSDVSTNDPEFTVTPTSFSLPRFAGQTLDVTFAPSQTGTVSKLLTIVSNDPRRPSIHAELTAEGTLAPIMSISPSAVSSVVESGETHLDSVYVSNPGGSPLAWTAEVTFSGAPSSETALPSGAVNPAEVLHILWHGDHGWGGIAYWSVITSNLIAQNATLTESNAPIDATLLQGYDVIWFGDRSAPFAPAELSALLDWTSAGGNVLVEADGNASSLVYTDLLEGLGSSIYYLSSPGTAGLTPNIMPHETTTDVDEIYLVSVKTLLVALSPAVPLVADSNGMGRTVIACEGIGQGKLIVLADHTFHDLAIGFGDNLLFARHVFEWFGLARWLSVAPASGTLGPGETALIEAMSDATSLAAGDHRLNLVVRGNDPATPSITVPVLLVVESGDPTGIDPDEIPARFELHANYPNPFNPTTTIAYDLPKNVKVRLVIYDVSGRKIRELVDASEPAGRHSVIWDGRDSSNGSVATGVYFYKIIAGDFVSTRKMILLK